MSGHCNPALVQPAGLTLDQVRARMARHQPRVEELWRRYPVKRAVLLQVLWMVQEEYGWVPRVGIEWAAEVANVAPAHAFSVVEFYTMYRQVPYGRYFIQVCQTMCCHIQGAEDLIGALEAKLGIHVGETTADGLFTLGRVECLALCGTGPGVMINDQAIGPTPHKLGQDDLSEDWNHPEFHPDSALLERWIAALRAEAAVDPRPADATVQQHCAVGRPVLNTKGHPQGFGASAKTLPAGYAPPSPALKPAAKVEGAAVTVTWINDPLASALVVERSDDGGANWRELAKVGPKDQKAIDSLAPGQSASYRIIAQEKDRIARPSVVVSATGAEPKVATP